MRALLLLAGASSFSKKGAVRLCSQCARLSGTLTAQKRRLSSARAAAAGSDTQRDGHCTSHQKSKEGWWQLSTKEQRLVPSRALVSRAARPRDEPLPPLLPQAELLIRASCDSNEQPSARKLEHLTSNCWQRQPKPLLLQPRKQVAGGKGKS